MNACVRFFILFLVTMHACAAAGTSTPHVVNGWYAIDHPPKTADAIEYERQVRAHYEARVRQCFDLLPTHLRQEIKTEVFTSVFDPQHRITRIVSSKEELERMQQTPGTELVLYGAQTHATVHLPGSFLYVEGWSAVFVPATAFTDVWFCAAMGHELYHARRHALRNGMPQTRHELVFEEVAAHELERSILNHLTSGAYEAAIQSALSVEQGSLAEYLPLVEHVFAPAASDTERGIRYAQIHFDLIFTRAESTYCIPEARKVMLYEWLRAQHTE